MKITMPNGFIFEGTQSEYDVFMATLEAQSKAQYVPQEGDIVVITANTCGSRNAVGDIGKITKVGSSRFEVIVPNGPKDSVWTVRSDFRKATPAEVEEYEKALADASKPKLKAGDFVKFEEPDLYDITVGKIYEVKTDDDDALYIIDDAGDKDTLYLEEFAIKADKEAEKWAKLGRKVGELKKGDVVRVIDHCGALGVRDGQLIEVINDSDADSANVKGNWYVIAELVASVESTLN